MKVLSCSVVSDCDPMDCNSSVGILGRNTGMNCNFLFLRIFPTQGLNLYLLWLLHRQVDSLPLNHLGSPRMGILGKLRGRGTATIFKKLPEASQGIDISRIEK